MIHLHRLKQKVRQAASVKFIHFNRLTKDDT